MERQQETERQENLSEGATENLQEQLEVAELLNKFGGVETEQYREQLGLLKLKHSGLAEITDEQRKLNAELAREQATRERQQALAAQRGERAQIGREREHLGQNILAQQFTGLPGRGIPRPGADGAAARADGARGSRGHGRKRAADRAAAD